MNILDIPFNKFIGLKQSDIPGYLLMIEDNPSYLNHLSTVHASALFALAEASSGQFLLNEFSSINNCIPVVRKVETRFRKPANGTIYSSASLIGTTTEQVIFELTKKQKALLSIQISLFDSENNKIMLSIFEWFISNNPQHN